MVASSRPDQAALPVRSRPQLLNKGDRTRVTHLPRWARIRDDATPSVLPDINSLGRSATGVAQGLSYRNAAFHALLNTPIFVNFLRAHRNRVIHAKRCPVFGDCLLCHMFTLAAHYWSSQTVPQTAALNTAILALWKACLETFWGPNSKGRQTVGPASENDEFFTESFLLHFLATVQKQLEASPAEFQTFLRLFTTHIVRTRKCSNAVCKWISSAFRWEQSLFLPIDVRKPIGKNAKTDILTGIQSAIGQEPKDISMRKSSLNGAVKCPSCNLTTLLDTEIVNFPEVLILVRDMDRLGPADQPNIHLQSDVKMKPSAGGLVEYRLMSGAADMSRDGASNSVAFARGGRPDNQHHWWLLEPDGIGNIPGNPDGLSTLDQLQVTQSYPAENGTAPHQVSISPEVLIYVRTDGDGLRTSDIDSFAASIAWGADSPPVIDPIAIERDLVSRSVTDIFTQKIGNGLLKFKVKFTPADPLPHESIPFTLDVSYEHENKHYQPERSIYGRLMPIFQRSADTDPQREPHHRYRMRQQGPATPVHLTDAERQLLQNDGVPAYPSMGFPKEGPKGPFVFVSGPDPDDMEIDSQTKTGFADDQVMKEHAKRANNAVLEKLYNEAKTGSKEQDWRRAHANNGKHNNRDNQHNGRNGGKGNKGQNRNQNSGGNKKNRGNQNNQNNRGNQNQQNNGGDRRTNKKRKRGGGDY